ncbi:ABC transporter ATP-binding protein [Paenibacillaceae bacterium]|nr:ABC transporter ATP-binding protein [Paenibacillaceae bacterium]
MNRPIDIDMKDIVKTYQMGSETMVTLKKVSLQVYRGEFMAIIGPSGSGKSTLMNIIGCLDMPTAGQYIIDGQDTNRMSGNRLAEIRNQKIGFIFQSFHLLSQLSSLENVELPLIYRGMPAKQRRGKAADVLAQMGLADKLHHKPKELSGGQQQRVAIARALVSEPSILLADEPTGALDTKTGKEVLAIFRDLHQKGHTIVLISHDPQVAESAESVIRITDGTITEERRGSRAI